MFRGVWVLGTLLGACRRGQWRDTYGPHSTCRERTLSIPRSQMLVHSPVISTERPWKFSWSYTRIWSGKNSREDGGQSQVKGNNKRVNDLFISDSAHIVLLASFSLSLFGQQSSQRVNYYQQLQTVCENNCNNVWSSDVGVCTAPCRTSCLSQTSCSEPSSSQSGKKTWIFLQTWWLRRRYIKSSFNVFYYFIFARKENKSNDKPHYILK